MLSREDEMTWTCVTPGSQARLSLVTKQDIETVAVSHDTLH